MKPQHFFGSLLALLTLSFAACETTVEIPLPPHEKRIVINSLLQAEKELEVYVSRSYAPTENLNAETVMLTDAIVELLYKEQVVSKLTYRDTTLTNWDGEKTKLGKYVSEGYVIETGGTYTLRVSHPDYPTATATASAPPPARILNTTLIQDTTRKVYEDGYTEYQSLLRVRVQDTAAFFNYYKLESLVFEISNFAPLEDTIEMPGYGIGGQAEQAGDGSLESTSDFVSDESFNGQVKDIDFLFQMPGFYVNNDVIRDYDIYSYTLILTVTDELNKNHTEKVQLQRENQDGIGFLPSEPVIVDSNVENGYGMFAGVTQTKLRVEF